MYGLEPHYHAMHWGDGEAFAPKLDRVLAEIDELKSQGYTVSLVGSSAGAGAVLNAYAQRKDAIAGVVYICGKIQNAQTIHERTYQRNPAFRQSLDMLQGSIRSFSPQELDRILSIHPLRDGLVPVPDTKIPGVKEKTIYTIGHAFSIGFALILGSRTIAKFLNSKV
jgi:pimeloyl-ACP methyl ester carboxylesterase